MLKVADGPESMVGYSACIAIIKVTWTLIGSHIHWQLNVTIGAQLRRPEVLEIENRKRNRDRKSSYHARFFCSKLYFSFLCFQFAVIVYFVVYFLYYPTSLVNKDEFSHTKQWQTLDNPYYSLLWITNIWLIWPHVYNFRIYHIRSKRV